MAWSLWQQVSDGELLGFFLEEEIFLQHPTPRSQSGLHVTWRDSFTETVEYHWRN